MINKLISDKEKELFNEISFNKNQIIFNEGSFCDEVSFVIEGEVLISSITNSNNETIFNNIKKGGCFGDVLCFSSSPYYLGDVIALNKTKLLTINKMNLIKLLTTNKIFFNYFLTKICDETLKSKRKNKLLLIKNNTDRLLHFIEQKAKEQNTNEIKIKSVVWLSNELGLPRESASRSIKKLVDDNKITFYKKIITLI